MICQHNINKEKDFTAMFLKQTWIGVQLQQSIVNYLVLPNLSEKNQTWVPVPKVWFQVQKLKI